METNFAIRAIQLDLARQMVSAAREVLKAEHILTQNVRCAFLGSTGVEDAFHDRSLATAKHCVTLTMVKSK